MPPLLPIKHRLLAQTPAWHLLLDKYSYGLEQGAPRLRPKKIETLPQVLGAYQRGQPYLQSAVQSRLDLLTLLEKQHGALFRRVALVNSSRLLLHLGRSSVLENVGLYAERPTGLPVIPGSAVKGVVSTWACWESHFQETDGSFAPMIPASIQRQNFRHIPRPLAQSILGDNRSSGSESAGSIIFLGAFPVKAPPAITLDIVTPHNGPRILPNPFLAIDVGTEWAFALLAHPSASEPAEELDAASNWITEALGIDGIGLGAKTASGYGRFITPEEWKKSQRPRAAAPAKAADVAAHAVAQKTLASDYPNDATFKARVLDHLLPAKISALKNEVPILQKPENAARLEQLKALLIGKDAKYLRKVLKDKHASWFPQEWLPVP